MTARVKRSTLRAIRQAASTHTLLDRDQLVAHVKRMSAEANARLADAAELSRNPSKRSDSDYLLQLLAFEILLKAVLRIHQISPLRNHSYSKLFDALPIGVRARVISTATERMTTSGADYSDMARLLNIFARNFTALRYPYEKYEGMTADAYDDLGKRWVEEDAPLSQATFVYHSEDLYGLTFALQSEVDRWLDSPSGGTDEWQKES